MLVTRGNHANHPRNDFFQVSECFWWSSHLVALDACGTAFVGFFTRLAACASMYHGFFSNFEVTSTSRFSASNQGQVSVSSTVSNGKGMPRNLRNLLFLDFCSSEPSIWEFDDLMYIHIYIYIYIYIHIHIHCIMFTELLRVSWCSHNNPFHACSVQQSLQFDGAFQRLLFGKCVWQLMHVLSHYSILLYPIESHEYSIISQKILIIFHCIQFYPMNIMLCCINALSDSTLNEGTTT